MPNFEITFDDGEVVTVGLSTYKPSISALIALARSKYPQADRSAVRIERMLRPHEKHSLIGDAPTRELVWAAETVVQLPPVPESVRIFITFTYEEKRQTTCGLSRVVTGNVVADIEYEPYEMDHVAGLQEMIAQAEGLNRVIITGWQKVDRP